MADALRIGPMEITLTQAEVIDSIKDIRLATSIQSCQCIGTFGKSQFPGFVIPEIEQRQVLQKHAAKVEETSGLAQATTG